MDPERLLPAIWNWLPAFRAVAETQHLPSASRRLNLTAAALSRSIRLLEDAVGQQLFNRVGRNIVLNTAGERLLLAVEEATRAVDAALITITSDPLSGPVRVSTLGVLTNEYVLPALLALRGEHPALVPRIGNHMTREANDLLARGLLDVAFYYDAQVHDALVIERLGASSASVYCGRGHPLFKRKRIPLEDVLAHPFSVPQIGEKGMPMDGWPVDVPREIGMQITLLGTNLEVALSGQLLTVLPDVSAFPFVEEGRLVRLPHDLIAPVELYAARRRKEVAASAGEVVIEAVRRRIAAIDALVAPLRAGSEGGASTRSA